MISSSPNLVFIGLPNFDQGSLPCIYITFETSGSTKIEKTLTGADKLSNLLESYDPYTIPVQDNSSITIESTLSINHINLVGQPPELNVSLLKINLQHNDFNYF